MAFRRTGLLLVKIVLMLFTFQDQTIAMKRNFPSRAKMPRIKMKYRKESSETEFGKSKSRSDHGGLFQAPRAGERNENNGGLKRGVFNSTPSLLRRFSLGLSRIPPPRTSASTSTHFRSPPACLCFIDSQ